MLCGRWADSANNVRPTTHIPLWCRVITRSAHIDTQKWTAGNPQSVPSVENHQLDQGRLTVLGNFHF